MFFLTYITTTKKENEGQNQEPIFVLSAGGYGGGEMHFSFADKVSHAHPDIDNG